MKPARSVKSKSASTAQTKARKLAEAQATALAALENDVGEYVIARDTSKSFGLAMKESQERISDYLDTYGSFHTNDDGRVSLDLELGGKIVKVTQVTPTSVVVDEDGIKKALTPEQWAQCTVTEVRFDLGLFTAAIAAGKIDQSVLTKNAHEEPKKSYPKITT